MNIQLPRAGGARQAGLTLIEILVAMALGLLLIAGVLQVFSGSSSSARMQEGVSRVQEGGRFSLELMKPDIRMAGLNSLCGMGLPPPRNHVNINSPQFDPDIFNVNRPVFGWEFVGTAPADNYSIASIEPGGVAINSWQARDGGGNLRSLSTLLQNAVVPGSDVLLVSSVRPVPNLSAVGNTPANANAINLNAAHGTMQSSVLLVTDCVTSDLFQNPTNNNSTSFSRGNAGGIAPGNRNMGSWSTTFGPTMQVYQVNNSVYYVGRRNANSEPGFFRRNFGTAGSAAGTAVELVEGVESMQVLYGIGIGEGGVGGIQNYVTANNVNDWAQVMAVRVSLLLRSGEQVDTVVDTRTFPAAGTVLQPVADRRYRQLFDSTVAVRNAVEVR